MQLALVATGTYGVGLVSRLGRTPDLALGIAFSLAVDSVVLVLLLPLLALHRWAWAALPVWACLPVFRQHHRRQDRVSLIGGAQITNTGSIGSTSGEGVYIGGIGNGTAVDSGRISGGSYASGSPARGRTAWCCRPCSSRTAARRAR